MKAQLTFGKFVEYSLYIAVGIFIGYLDLLYLIPYIIMLLGISLGKDIQNFISVDVMYQMKKERSVTYIKKESSKFSSRDEHQDRQEKELIYLKELKENIVETIRIKSRGYGIILLILLAVGFFAIGGFDLLEGMNSYSNGNFVNLEGLKK